MSYIEYKVVVRSSEGERARVIVHAGSDADARRMAEEATGLQVVSVKREA